MSYKTPEDMQLFVVRECADLLSDALRIYLDERNPLYHEPILYDHIRQLLARVREAMASIPAPV
jgi:hypothetical protein